MKTFKHLMTEAAMSGQAPFWNDQNGKKLAKKLWKPVNAVRTLVLSKAPGKRVSVDVYPSRAVISVELGNKIDDEDLVDAVMSIKMPAGVSVDVMKSMHPAPRKGIIIGNE